MSRMKSVLNGYQLLELLQPEGALSKSHPFAYEIIRALQSSGIRVTEVDFHPHAVWVGLAAGINLIIYNRRGNVLVQGARWQDGIWRKRLERHLPAETVWQLREA